MKIELPVTYHIKRIGFTDHHITFPKEIDLHKAVVVFSEQNWVRGVRTINNQIIVDVTPGAKATPIEIDTALNILCQHIMRSEEKRILVQIESIIAQLDEIKSRLEDIASDIKDKSSGLFTAAFAKRLQFCGLVTIPKRNQPTDIIHWRYHYGND